MYIVKKSNGNKIVGKYIFILFYMKDQSTMPNKKLEHVYPREQAVHRNWPAPVRPGGKNDQGLVCDFYTLIPGEYCDCNLVPY